MTAAAFDRLAESRGLLLIVSRSNVHRVEGVITFDDIAGWLQRRASANRRGVQSAGGGAAGGSSTGGRL